MSKVSTCSRQWLKDLDINLSFWKTKVNCHINWHFVKILFSWPWGIRHEQVTVQAYECLLRGKLPFVKCHLLSGKGVMCVWDNALYVLVPRNILEDATNLWNSPLYPWGYHSMDSEICGYSNPWNWATWELATWPDLHLVRSSFLRPSEVVCNHAWPLRASDCLFWAKKKFFLFFFFQKLEVTFLFPWNKDKNSILRPRESLGHSSHCLWRVQVGSSPAGLELIDSEIHGFHSHRYHGPTCITRNCFLMVQS